MSELSQKDWEEIIVHIYRITINQYKANRTITWQELAMELRRVSGVDWQLRLSNLCRAVTELNACLGSMESTCVVDKNGIPASGFFIQAKALGLLKKDATTEEMLEFWLGEFRRRVQERKQMRPFAKLTTEAVNSHRIRTLAGEANTELTTDIL